MQVVPAADPLVVRKSFVSMVSFIVSGTPWSGPTCLPLIRYVSAARAWSRISGAIVMIAFSAGLRRSILRRWASTTSTGDTARDRINAASSVADFAVSSSDTAVSTNQRARATTEVSDFEKQGIEYRLQSGFYLGAKDPTEVGTLYTINPGHYLQRGVA